MSDTLQNNFSIKGKKLLRVELALCFVLLVLAKIGILDEIAVKYSIALSSSFAFTVLFMPFTMWLAHKVGVIDIPGARRIHSAPTPRWGGIALGIGAGVALVITSWGYMPHIKALLISSYLMLLCGAIDDFHHIPALIKLLIQVLAAVILIADGVVITFLPPDVWWGLAGRWLITIVWLVGITNAINFLDGMDGLLAGLVMGCCLIFFVIALMLGNTMLAICVAAIFGATVGFLPFNITPAKSFLGDGGSTFLGFMLAALSVHGSWAKNNPLVSFFVPVLILSVPIYDMIFTTIARIVSGKVRSFNEWVAYTGKDHIHHRLEALGLSRAQVVFFITILNLSIGLGAITIFEARTYGGITLVIQTIYVYMIIALLEVLGSKRRNNSQYNETSEKKV
jgi:UDP-GlcNAc:undecaprenyl-phosphate GlcNAc-1-phosphate transferase